MQYSAENTLRLAKRLNNSKRSYLLVNPLQAKHMPVSPAAALEMMTSLGSRVAAKYPSARLVIGFAETATAIGAAAAKCLHPDCKYIQTTRESGAEASEWLFFYEEHSHAVEQRLHGARLRQWIEETPQIILVDDEISTGKTLLNIVEQIRSVFPGAAGKEIVAASIIGRLSPEHEKRLAEAGITSEFLVRLEPEELSSVVEKYKVSPAAQLDPSCADAACSRIFLGTPLPDPRYGISVREYEIGCRRAAEDVLSKVSCFLLPDIRILVLGTEECMYPSLVLGSMIERYSRSMSVRCHATTRSPIGVLDDRAYPIRSGVQVHSFYEEARTTFLYNLGVYDLAIVLTDAGSDHSRASADIARALRMNGCGQVVIVEGGPHV